MENKKQTIIILLIIACVLLLLEMGVRYYEVSGFCPIAINDIYQNLTFQEKSMLCGDANNLQYYNNFTLIPNQIGNTFIINNHGFRGEDIIQDKPDHVYRIFIVGGSETFGAGSLSNDDTVSSLLQKKFETSGIKNIEIINAAVPGSFALPQNQLIQNKIIYYEPDLILINSGWNDLNIPFSGYNYTQMDKVSTERGTWHFVRDVLVDYRTPNTMSVWFAMMKIYSPLNSVVRPFDDSLLDKKAELWKERWMEICQKGNDKNFDVVIMLQPFVGTGNKSLSYQEKGYFVFFDHKNRVDGYELFAQKLNELDSVCTKVYDHRNLFDDFNYTIFRDRAHLGDLGNEIFSEELFDISSKIMNLKQ